MKVYRLGIGAFSIMMTAEWMSSASDQRGQQFGRSNGNKLWFDDNENEAEEEDDSTSKQRSNQKINGLGMTDVAADNANSLCGNATVGMEAKSGGDKETKRRRRRRR